MDGGKQNERQEGLSIYVRGDIPGSQAAVLTFESERVCSSKIVRPLHRWGGGGKEMPDGDDGDALWKNEYYEGFGFEDTERDWIRVVRHDEVVLFWRRTRTMKLTMVRMMYTRDLIAHACLTYFFCRGYLPLFSVRRHKTYQLFSCLVTLFLLTPQIS